MQNSLGYGFKFTEAVSIGLLFGTASSDVDL